mmetsp:Transcript_27360/g.63118  ORF Transcript_27360/g.63118 Transcript_27360/m.63118 type:complete len:166 (+) Transcript_27360:689-1186(+)
MSIAPMPSHFVSATASITSSMPAGELHLPGRLAPINRVNTTNSTASSIPVYDTEHPLQGKGIHSFVSIHGAPSLLHVGTMTSSMPVWETERAFTPQQGHHLSENSVTSSVPSIGAKNSTLTMTSSIPSFEVEREGRLQSERSETRTRLSMHNLLLPHRPSFQAET